MMDVPQREYQGMLNDLPNYNSTNDFNTQCTIDYLRTNHYKRDKNMCIDDSDDICPSEYFPFSNVMNDNDFCNPERILDRELREKIQKHKKSNSHGFNSLQNRIEKVKHDLKNLTNKLSPTGFEETEIKTEDNENGFYNSNIDNVFNDNEIHMIDDDDKSISEKNQAPNVDDTKKYQSKYKSKNPFSELSETTQNILDKLRLKDDDTHINQSIEDFEIQIELEEDDIEFTFSTRSNSLLNAFMSKDPMPVIEEVEEELSSDESDSDNSILNENVFIINNFISTPKSLSLHSFDVTETESYKTAMSNNYIHGDKYQSIGDTDEYFSDLANCSVSTGSSKESLQSHDVDKFGNMRPQIISEPYTDQNLENVLSLEDKFPVLTKVDDEVISEAEYDNSVWSTDDFLQSMEQSDSLYEQPLRPSVKSSLPNLLENSDTYQFEKKIGSRITQNFNKSTDLDELLDQPLQYSELSSGRLSQSLCNLVPTLSNNLVRVTDSFQERTSFDNLLETDLDSGYVSIYMPTIETEIISKAKFSSSMGNVSEIRSSSPFISRLRQQAGSTTELRIADSLTKLNIPSWLDANCLKQIQNKQPSSTQSPPTAIKKAPHISQTREITRPRQILENCSIPVIKPTQSLPVVLPSQILKQRSQRKLVPIKVCQARQLLLPNKMTLNNPSVKIKC